MPDAGNSVALATQLNPNSTAQTFVDTFGGSDSDYFRIDINSRSSLSLSLTGLTGDATLRFLGSDGQDGAFTIAESTNSDTLAEALTQTLTAGTYFVQVLAVGNTGGDYTLSYAAKPENRVDIFWREASGASGVWHMGGSQNGSITSISPMPTIGQPWEMAAIADFNKDGTPDYLWREPNSGANGIWYMGGENGTSISQTVSLPAVPGKNWTVGGVADFNKDGFQDIVWREAGGSNGIWLMGGDGTSISQTVSLPAVPGSWKIVGVTDFDRDGNTDILWRETTQGSNGYWRMGGVNGTSLQGTVSLPAVPSNWEIAGIADFNNDARLDIFWRETTQGNNGVWLMTGADNNSISSTVSLPSVGPTWDAYAYSWKQDPYLDLAGNTPTAAFNLGTLNGKGIYRDRVSTTDPDVYTFTVKTRSDISLSLNALGLTMELRDSAGNLVSTGNGVNGFTGISQTVSAGTYTLQSAGATTPTNYILAVNGLPTPPPVVSLIPNDFLAAETLAGQPPNPGSFTISRTGDAGLPITVLYSITGTATNGTDYANLSNSVTLAAGQTSVTLPINIIDDTIAESTETIILTLGNGTGYTISPTNTAVIVNIADNDQPVVTVSASDPQAVEAGGEGVTDGAFTFSRTGPTTEALTVSYTLGGTATAGSDYTGANGTITIPVGQSSVTLPLLIADDSDYEGTETVILTVSDTAVYEVGQANTATVAIADNDLPTISLSVTDPNAAEVAPGETPNPGAIAITRTGITTEALTVNYTVSGTATNGGDYSSLGGAIVIPIGQSSVTVPISVLDDTVSESNETVTISLSSNTTYSLGSTTNGSVTITDNDDAGGNTPATARDIGSLSSLQSFNDRVDVNDPDDYYKFTVAQTTAFVARLKNLTDDVDLALFDASLTLIAGSFNSGTLDEQILTEVGPGTYYLRVLPNAPAESNYTLDVVEVPKVTVTAIDANALETTSGESPDPGAFTITRTGPTTEALTVNYTVSGNATNSTDYANLIGSVVIPIGQSSVTVPITVIDDAVEEGNETVIINLANSSTYSTGNTGSVTVTIADNDLPLPDLKASNLSITRGTFEKGSDFAIRFNLGNNTAYSAGSFNVGVYLSTDSTITTADRFLQAIDIPGLAANENPSVGLGTILLPNVNDSFWQASNTYYVGLIVDPQNSVTELRENNNSNQGIGTDILAITVTEPPPTVSISATKAQASEANDSIGEIKIPGEFTISRSGGIGEALTVNYTVSGTATSGTDYTSLSGTVTIPVGQTSVMIPVNVIDDTTQESSETVIVSLESSANYSLGNSSSTVNIADNDAPSSDLRINGIRTGNGGTTFAQGQVVDLRYTINNRTAYSVPSTFRVDYYLSTDANITTGDRLIGSRTISYGINANSGVGEGSLLNLPTAGDSFWQAGTTYYLGTVLDAGNTVTEANEVNNINQGIGVDILQITVTSGVATA